MKTVTKCFHSILHLTIMIIIGIHIPGQVNAQSLSFLDFQNTSIGFGMNSATYTMRYPEIPDFYNTSLKRSFLIDIRTNFLIPHGLRFSPTFELWSWTDNSGKQYDVTQNGANDYLFCFDIAKPILNAKPLQWYVGTGVGIHFFTSWTAFPRFSPYYSSGRRIRIQSIAERRIIISPDLITGIEYHIWEGFYLSVEIRRETNSPLKQWKYILGISMF